jgi:hypothetical protein
MKLPTKTEAQQLAWQFMLNENKPAWCRSIDVLLTANIILLSNEEGMCWASQGTLSAMMGSSPDSVRRSLDLLVGHGWITETNRKNSYQSNTLFPQFHNIPFGVFRSELSCDDARKLTARYYETVRALPKIKSANNRMRAAAYPHKGWPQHWGMVMQNWLAEGWTAEQIQTVVDYAFSHVGDIAKRGPQCLKSRFASLAASAGVHLTPTKVV